MGQLPCHARTGLTLVGLCWILNWGLEGLRTHLLFFPQWLGYCLFLSGLTQLRTGSSLLRRNPRAYAGLFLVSIPVWWLFEGLNVFTGNWVYLGREAFGPVSYTFFSSLSFSTVIPAVFSTTEFLGTFRYSLRIRRFRGFPCSRRTLWLFHAGGWLMLVLVIALPGIFFPFLWLCLFFILDPLNGLRGKSSLLVALGGGETRGLVLLGLGALVCGFFWELWNIYAYPKWIYDIPYLEFWHLFEMPLAGYGGYIPFAWELYAVHHFLPGRKVLTLTPMATKA
jgi:hypothetical protein